MLQYLARCVCDTCGCRITVHATGELTAHRKMERRGWVSYWWDFYGNHGEFCSEHCLNAKIAEVKLAEKGGE